MEKEINKIIEKIFYKNKIGEINSVEKIDIGFTNEIYSINNKFILKICKSKSNEKNFRKEVLYYRLFRGKIPVPKLIFYDTSKKVLNHFYIVYHKIDGDNLYSQWHLLNNQERKSIIKQICSILKFISKKDRHSNKNWYRKRYSSTKKFLNIVKNKKIISKEFINKIESFIEKNKDVLHEQKLGLVYWDVHFDNFLIKNKRIIGIIDFEDIEVMSIDYTLDSVRRMVNYPKVYVSQNFERFIKKKDYSQLLTWFKIFYPKLFNFRDLNKRLDLYSVEYDLRLLPEWSKSKSLKRRLAKTVGFRYF